MADRQLSISGKLIGQGCQCYRKQDPDNCDHDHQFDQRKAFGNPVAEAILSATHVFALRGNEQ